MCVKIFNKQHHVLKFLIFIAGIILPLWIAPIWYEVPFSSYFNFDEDAMTMLVIVGLLFLIYWAIVTFLLWIYDLFKNSSAQQVVHSLKAETDLNKNEKLSRGAVNIIIAIIIGLSLLLSSFFYAKSNRYVSIRDGYFILDKWTGKTEPIFKK